MNSRVWLATVVFAASFAAATPSVSAQGKPGGAISVWNPIIAASVDRLSIESPSWRDALDAVAATGRRAVLIAADAVDGFDSERLAQARPVVDERSRIDTVVVVINLELLQRLSGLPVKAVGFEEDLDRIVAHEVYGHAIPFLLAGTVAGRCSDPVDGQSASDACAIARENVIRKEMGLGRRFDSGREGLAFARRHWNY